MGCVLYYTRVYVGYTLCGTCCSRGWEPEWSTVWHFIMHAAVIHLELRVTPSAAVTQIVLQHNLSTFKLSSASWHRAVFCVGMSMFLHPSSRIQCCKSTASTVRSHTCTKCFNPVGEGRMFLSNGSIHKTSRYQSLGDHNLTDSCRRTLKVTLPLNAYLLKLTIWKLGFGIAPLL